MNQGKQPIMAVFMTTIILGSTVAIGYMLQPAAAQETPRIPAGCPPNTQSFERGFCVGPEPQLTYECDGDPPNLILIGDECVLFDYREPAILVDIECSGQFPILEGIERCLARPGDQQNRGP